MDKNTDNLLRAILRCAIATENHRTNEILKEDLPNHIIAPTYDGDGRLMMHAVVVPEREYRKALNLGNEKMGDLRYFTSFNTLNKYFFKTSSPLVKQGYIYLRHAEPENRIREVMNDLNRPEHAHRVFSEIRNAFNAYGYSQEKMRDSNYVIDPPTISDKINDEIKNRTGLRTMYDFSGLLDIMKNDLEGFYESSKTNAPEEKKTRNTVLNYLNTYTLCEYYFYRKTINDYIFARRGPIYKNTPDCRVETLQKALNSQIYSEQNRDKDINFELFKNPMLEGITSEPIDHNEAKRIVKSVLKERPELIDDIAPLLNEIMSNKDLYYKGENYSTLAKAPSYSIEKVKVKALESPTGKSSKIECSLLTTVNPVATENRKNCSDKIKNYFIEREREREKEELNKKYKNSTQLHF